MIDRIVSIKSDNISAYAMSDELEFKFEVEIKSTDKKQTLSKEVKAELEDSGIMDEKGKLKLKGVSAKMLKRMKGEYVDWFCVRVIV